MKSVTEISRVIESKSRALKLPFFKSARAGSLPKAVSVAALSVLLGLAACDNDYTLAFVYGPSASLTSGLINAYGIDNQTGALRLLNDSPIPSGGRKPTAIAAAPNHQAIYVTNHDDSNVVEFTIGTDGKLYPQNTYDTSGSYPTSVAVSADGKFLYVAYTYQIGFTTASPGPGGISIYPIKSDNSLGPVSDFPIGRSAVAVAVSSKPLASGLNVVYIAAQDAASVNPSAGQPAATHPFNQTVNLFAFAADATSGALSPLPGETINSGNTASFGYATGLAPARILEDASGSHLYVSDATGNEIIPYTVGSNGVPALIPNPTATVSPGDTPYFYNAITGAGPGGMTIEPTGKYFFVANYEGTIGEYTFGPSGELIPSTVAASTGAGTGTTCVTVEPTHGVYLYASGSLSNTITGEQILPADGTLKPIINSPYTATTLPLCAVAVARF